MKLEVGKTVFQKQWYAIVYVKYGAIVFGDRTKRLELYTNKKQAQRVAEEYGDETAVISCQPTLKMNREELRMLQLKQ